MNNNMARLYFIMTRTMLFSCGYAQQIINNRKKCSWFAGHFDGHAESVSPTAAGLGLPQMPLDAAIGRVLAPYRPSGCHDH